MTVRTNILVLLFVLFSAEIIACSCVGAGSVETECKNSDLVVTGTVICSETVKLWADTSNARQRFNDWKRAKRDHYLSYEAYKIQDYLLGPEMMEYEIVITERFKSSVQQDTIKIRTGFGGGDCGFRFEVGSEYLIYATEEYAVDYWQPLLNRTEKELKGIFRTSICDRTCSISNAKADLEKLRKH
jgi:hypothetical protein